MPSAGFVQPAAATQCLAPFDPYQHEAALSEHELVKVIASADAAIRAENFDALMNFYAADAMLAIEPGRTVTGYTGIRQTFLGIAEHFNHTLCVSQEEVLVLEGAGAAFVLANTRVRATPKTGEPYDVLRRATYLLRKEERGGASSTTRTARTFSRRKQAERSRLRGLPTTSRR